MKPTFFLFLVICMGLSIQAQEKRPLVMAKVLTMPVVTETIHQTKTVNKESPRIAAIYLLKNSRIKKALAFEPKKRETKLV
ncbi:hypothetical protein [Maribacter sp. 2210JD10-5]|uniref:hypothetical protein n=1 Tax=Maribacter sp. 2210JD10-5 TaxID=3386272 RepID=UPI0039BD7576